VASTTQATIKGVQPLRAGEGTSFYWRRLHSLLGIIPLGAFLIEHLVSNSEAIKGAVAYAHVTMFLNALPLKPLLEWFGIFLPLAFHAIYGLYIWYRGKSNIGSYKLLGNIGYTLQRVSAGLLVLFLAWHLYGLRFSGVVLAEQPGESYSKVVAQMSTFGGLGIAFFAIGVIAAAWHFGYGLFLFASKWGIVTGQKSQRNFQLLTFLVTLGFIGLGAIGITAFICPQIWGFLK